MAGRRGFGSTRKLPSGRWQARFLGPDMVRHVGPTTFQTKGDAQAWLAEERRMITQGQWISPEERAIRAAAAESTRRGRTLSVYAKQWLAGRVTSVGAALRPSTMAGYRNSLDVHILPRFGPLPLDEITTAAVREWRGQFSASGHDAAGAKAYGLLKAILQTAEDDELLLRNPCRLRGARHSTKNRQSICSRVWLVVATEVFSRISLMSFFLPVTEACPRTEDACRTPNGPDHSTVHASAGANLIPSG